MKFSKLKVKQLVVVTCALACMVCTGCRPRSNQSSKEGTTSVSNGSVPEVQPVYAEGFTVTYTPTARLIDIRDPQQESAQSFHYALVPRGGEVPRAGSKDIPEGYTVIETPVRSAICMTSLQLSNFIKLDARDRVVGITSTRHLFDKEMNRRLKEGKTAKIGIEGNFDSEVIMSIEPDVIFISPFKRGGYDVLHDVDIPLVPHLGYKEMSPLGQAEWIKFIGMFIGKEELANSLFAQIEEHYNELKTLAARQENRPVVFSGEMRGGNWYAVGGKSFLAQIFKDAGGDYFMKDDERSGGVTLDFETVYSQAVNADYWRIVNSHNGEFTYDALKSEDSRYADFKAFRDKGIIYCNMRQKPFYETMPVEPELVLSDFIHVFHPGLLPDYVPHYYELLK
ncbi:ABC transporter substrate-binding protein [Bacteroides sp. 51]|uniref:ABC transporter substrate-binding protein n=1 Tax=Bacteroides sp. 51 TaxID=2302938 RepID=UPI0013D06DF6|nr:ABC transporter substrate-binding protein [Bacteroides sp. 51]NDV81994.1 iron ABC transporter substrate-binding protein [Bacteroides sp. 51]